MKFSSRGFTLVELMIVIAIIGILAAALFPSLTAYLKRSRDAGRSANLNTIATAVGAYYSDKEAYPSSSSGCVDSSLLSTNYLPKGVPTDPTSGKNNGCVAAGNYAYGSTGTSSTPGWFLSAYFENANGGNWSGTTFSGNTFTGNNVQFNSTTLAAQLKKGTGATYVMTN